MYRVGIRADGGSGIGMGHIIRCISLAKEFKANGYEVIFISKVIGGINRIKEEGFEVIELQSSVVENSEGFNYGNISELPEETQKIINTIKKYNVGLLLIDSYNVTKEYFLEIEPYVNKLAYIDDLNKFIYPVDILINGNITADYMNYKKYSEDELLFLGPKYNLIRDEFCGLPDKKINKEVKEIMITTGGSDPYNMSSKILNILLDDEELKKPKVNVIIGGAFDNKKELEVIAKNHKNVILHENVRHMSQIMLQSDIAISAGGSTLYELCACGTPTLAFIMADNQEFIVQKMDELGYLQSLGWYNKIEQQMLRSNIKKLIKEYDIRMTLRNRGRFLVDANGVKRIVLEI